MSIQFVRRSAWVTALVLSVAASHVDAQSSAQSAPQSAAAPAARAPGEGRVTRPSLFLKEEWKLPAGKTGEQPLTAESNDNPNLEMTLHVPSGEAEITGLPGDDNNPTHAFLGLCTSPCAITFKDKGHFADLSGLARIRWNIKTAGFHQVRPIVKLADGTWLIGDRADAAPRDWLVSEVSLADIRWLKLDIARVVTAGLPSDKVDLSKVDEIGFADLMPGSGHGQGGWSDVAQIEVYGKPVTR